MRRNYLKDALERVINAEGMTSEANSIVHTKAINSAWESAKKQGLLRRVTADEEEAFIANRRSVRTVLLAMFHDAVEDETRSAKWDDGQPSINTLADKIDSVAFDIRNTRDSSGRLWTLTPDGIARLEEFYAS